jgi:hypothetical protein
MLVDGLVKVWKVHKAREVLSIRAIPGMLVCPPDADGRRGAAVHYAVYDSSVVGTQKLPSGPINPTSFVAYRDDKVMFRPKPGKGQVQLPIRASQLDPGFMETNVVYLHPKGPVSDEVRVKVDTRVSARTEAILLDPKREVHLGLRVRNQNQDQDQNAAACMDSLGRYMQTLPASTSVRLTTPEDHHAVVAASKQVLLETSPSATQFLLGVVFFVAGLYNIQRSPRK